MHEQVGSDALVEEYIEGRELYVGVMGNDRLTRLPVWEMVFGSLPDSLAAIATRKVKWDKRYQQKYGITTHEAKDLPAPVLARLDKLSRRIYRALGLSGYARMDFRVTADGRGLCPRGERQSQPRSCGGFRGIRRRRRRTLQRAARAAHDPGIIVSGTVAGIVWISVASS